MCLPTFSCLPDIALLAANRFLMRKKGILKVLSQLLPEDGAMQRETLGATNNFTIDGSLSSHAW